MELLVKFAKWLYDTIGPKLLILSPILGLIGWFVTALPTINDGLVQAKAKLIELKAALVTALPQVEAIWNAARYWFPVDLALVLAGILLALRLIATAVRLIKGMIPLWN